MTQPDDPGPFDYAEQIDVRPLERLALFCLGMVAGLILAMVF